MPAESHWREAYQRFDAWVAMAPVERERRRAELEPEVFECLAAMLRELEHPVDLAPGGDHAGLEFESYRLIEEIGRGGSSVVYRATQRLTGYDRDVAVKVFSRGFALSARPDLTQEQSILARLEHPNIVTLLDSGTLPDGTGFLVMPFVDGERIDIYAKKRAASARDCVRLLLGVVDAVAFAQQNLVVHRDIKPGNILVSRDGHVSVLDFGIAKLLDGSEEGSSTRVLTPEFGAPEQFSGEAITTATDVYSIGVTAYLLLTGSLADRAEVKRPSSFDGALRGIDRDLDNIVRMALREEPHRRYASARELGEDLRRWLGGETVHATPDSWAYRVSKLVGRNRAAFASATVSILALVAGLTVAVVQAEDAREQARLSRAVTDVLVDSFTAADPTASSGGEVSAREILDRAAEQIDRSDLSDSAIRGELLVTLADVSVRLGDWEAAAAQAKAALDGELPPEERTAAHVVMGIAHTLGGAYETASAAFERALMHASRCEVPERCRTDVRYEQANSLVSQLRYREAVTVLEPLVDSLRQARRIALARAWLGASYQALGDFDAARSQIEMALATKGLEPFDEAEVLTNAAGVYGDFGELEKVSQLQRRGLNLVREQLGPSHPYTLTQLNNQALALKNLGRFAEAEAMLRQVVRERTEAYGPDNVDLSATHFNLAHALVLQERLEEALVSFEEAIRVGSLAWPSSPRMGLFKVIYADALSRLGRSRQAERFFASGLALMPVNADGSLHPLTARTRVRFAAFASERGRHPQALKTFVEVAPVLREVYGPDSRQYAECQWYHGLALQRAGRLEEGKATLLEAVNSLEASPYRALYQKEIERGRSQLP